MFSGIKMVKHSRTFTRADDDAWPLFVQTAERGGFELVGLPRSRYRSLRQINALTWTPTSKSVHFRAWQGMHPLWVIHHAMHYLCDTHSGVNKGPHPMSMLYFENIACNIDPYFAARIVQKVGVDAARSQMSDTYPFTLFAQTARAFGRSPDEHWRMLAAEEPFGLYKKVVREVDEVQRLVRETVGHWHRGPARARRLPLRSLRDAIHALPYIVFSSYFDHLLHLTFARFHQGTRATNRDLAAKRRCEDVLARSSCFADFMVGLGATPIAKRMA